MKKEQKYKNWLTVNELVTRVLCDTPPQQKIVDAIFLFAQTSDNEISVLGSGASLWRHGRSRRMCILDQKKSFGFPGFNSWKTKLTKRGIPPIAIIGIPLVSDFPPSTHAEAMSLIRFAAANGWRSIYIIAQPLHQLRAFITCVSVIKQERVQIKIYNHVGVSLRWQDHVFHSQGIQRGTRSSLLRKEIKKIEHYLETEDLVSPRGVLQYMDRRDRR